MKKGSETGMYAAHAKGQAIMQSKLPAIFYF